MRDFIIILLLILTIVKASFAQNNSFGERFEKVDLQVSEVSRQFIYHPQLLVEKLTEHMNNDYDKVRAIYVWIATNTEYDLLAFHVDNQNHQGIYDVLSSGKALCSGFSLLFEYLCKQAGIESVIIEGYAKGLGYEQNQKFKKVNHAWNAVFIHGSWYLLDVTWATGDPRRVFKIKKEIDLDTYFLASPGKFIYTHLPEDPSWQLLQNKVSLEDFENNTGGPFEDQDHYFNAFGPGDYSNMSEFDKDLVRYKRAARFNPANIFLMERISFAYLYKGISMTEAIGDLNYADLEVTIDLFCDHFNAYMDSAWITLAPIESWKMLKTKKILQEEVNYQHGIFNYEIGKTYYMKGQKAQVDPSQLDKKVDAYFKEAKGHFTKVPATSIYRNDALEYLTLISDFRAQAKTAQLPSH